MREGVVADLVPVAQLTAQQLRVELRVLPDNEERGRGAA
jgi:hypothetical protein